ncbi:hypothetical protein PIB30_102137, partial [Stylosanthes scabra]|nr:hypothetical protein [Stylosanthes scabra]
LFFPILPRNTTTTTSSSHLFSPLFVAATASPTRHHHCLSRCFLLSPLPSASSFPFTGKMLTMEK